MIYSLWEASPSAGIYSNVCVSFAIGAAVRTMPILFMKRKNLYTTSTKLKDRLRETFWIWTNFRGIPFSNRDTVRSITGDDIWSRIRFADQTLTLSFHIWGMDYIVNAWVRIFIRWLKYTISDFAPAKQSLLPSLNRHELFIRTIVSFHWIWTTYANITLAHGLLSILFVVILKWDLESEWPCLFGSLSEAYTLRRFWGVFWHRLHVAPFEAYMPSYLSRKEEEEHWWRHWARNSLRSLWIFFFSAGCHTIVQLVVMQRNTMVQEFRFFLSNYAACSIETVVWSVVQRKRVQYVGPRIWMRLLGYVWVFGFFFCTVPAWKYPLIYDTRKVYLTGDM
ncbi:hypothetical protein F4804DRAFT_349277 [Jackrogersella minutella]|nr:hypothetical protein F4804DRAFT_349277 [Jackrogersella minutella]